MGIGQHLTPGQAPWAHGQMELAVKRIKRTTAVLNKDNPEMDPMLVVYLACPAANSSEQHRGFSPHQWAYGSGPSELDLKVDEWHHRYGMEYSEGTSFAQLVAKRRSAEEVYRRVRALERLSVLANTKTRQPVRSYEIGELVKVWRHKEWFGIARPHWWGPGRVVLQETLPRPQVTRHGDVDDEARRHIIWVLVGGHLMRCSALSVRPLSDREREL